MKNLITKFIDIPITYDGTQLAPHWIYRRLNLCGNALVSFIGKADVTIDQMVDLEDVKSMSPIYSELMLHFIAEFFDMDLEKTVYRQRLLMVNIKERLEERLKRPLIRKGDDIYDGDKKLTVSIATLSPASTLIHAGINISSRNTPVPTRGLMDYDIIPEAFAKSVLDVFRLELESSWLARCKVRAAKGHPEM